MNSQDPGNSDGETSRLTEESSSTTESTDAVGNSTKNSAENSSTESENETQAASETRTVTTQTSPKNLQSTTSDNNTGTPIPSVSSAVVVGESEEMKRAAAKKLIERYFYQLLDGCGNPKCNNKFCASSGEVDQMSPNQAAARAIQLFSQDAKLCEIHPSKMPRTTHLTCMQSANDKESSNSSSHLQRSHPSNSKYAEASISPSASATASTARASSANLDLDGLSATSTSMPTSSNNRSLSSGVPSQSSTSSHKEAASKTSGSATAGKPWKSTSAGPAETTTSTTNAYLDEEKILELLETCKREQSYSKLIRTIGQVFSSGDLLGQSFQRRPSATIDEMLEKAPKDLKSIKKEDLRALEGDLDKDEDSSADKETEEAPHNTTVDLISLRRAMRSLFDADCSIYEPLNNGLHSLSITLSVDLRLSKDREKIEKSINIFVIAFEIMAMASSEFLEVALPNICRAAAHLPAWAQARIAWIWAEHCKINLRNLLQTLQQLISLQVITGNFNRDSLVQDNEVITSSTKVLKIVYYANMLAGKMESSKFRDDDDTLETSLSTIPEEDSLFSYSSSKQPKPFCLEDPIALMLEINVLDCRKPLLPFEEFYNEPLSDAIEMDNDYLHYKNITMDNSREGNKFSFMLYSFILTPATKTLALYYDSRIRMYSERRISIFQTQLVGQPPNPYLKLKVRREQIIDDALVELEMIAMGNPKDLKKQLVVEFVGEQGIDEGGVSKEFFQLIVEQIFNPDYGMFIHQEDTKTVWFNSTSFENEAQFTLIGIVLGLAIYNNIILAVNFPMVVYRKLMGIKGSFYDLVDWNPVLFRSLQAILDYEEADIEEVFMLTFKITYNDVFGNTLEHELKPNGGDIFVNQENKHEFVELYTDFLLNSSIEKQFRAFKKGFQMVTDESPLQLLFRPEEIELLVCGSKKFDFVELEKSTEYEGGYTEKSQIIVDFWSIVHALPLESKRKLLEFTTGSDRVPVGGLSRLKLVIARNGLDSDRLPTSHTCYNILLLPEYKSKEKLEDRLLKAINYSKGFGML